MRVKWDTAKIKLSALFGNCKIEILLQERRADTLSFVQHRNCEKQQQWAFNSLLINFIEVPLCIQGLY